MVFLASVSSVVVIVSNSHCRDYFWALQDQLTLQRFSFTMLSTEHPDIVARATAVISRFLLLQGSPCSSNNDNEGATSTLIPTVIRCEDVEMVRDQFEWIGHFSEFEFIPQYTPIFRDAEKGITCCNVEGGAYLVMPAKIPVIGEEALFWAKHVEME